MTNGEMIRAMKNDGLAEFLMAYPCQICDERTGKPLFCDDKYQCRECINDWLNEDSEKRTKNWFKQNENTESHAP